MNAPTLTAERLSSQTAVIHVMPIGMTHDDFMRDNAVVPVATYSATPAKPGAWEPHQDCVAEVMRLHPGHNLSYLDNYDDWG